MDISLIVKIAGVGILVAVATQILSKTGRDEQAMFVTIAGILVVLMLLISQIRDLFDLVTSVFGMG
ncbi:MAG: stage III sporulation protein AC [Ruminococcaceae bacterium]|nr:stage III sporulation protein AC [Oscillospiraceae bacterium]